MNHVPLLCCKFSLEIIKERIQLHTSDVHVFSLKYSHNKTKEMNLNEFSV